MVSSTHKHDNDNNNNNDNSKQNELWTGSAAGADTGSA